MDAELRQAERSDDPIALLRARLRARTVSREWVDVLAYAGDPVACELPSLRLWDLCEDCAADCGCESDPWVAPHSVASHNGAPCLACWTSGLLALLGQLPPVRREVGARIPTGAHVVARHHPAIALCGCETEREIKRLRAVDFDREIVFPGCVEVRLGQRPGDPVNRLRGKCGMCKREFEAWLLPEVVEVPASRWWSVQVGLCCARACLPPSCCGGSHPSCRIGDCASVASATDAVQRWLDVPTEENRLACNITPASGLPNWEWGLLREVVYGDGLPGAYVRDAVASASRQINIRAVVLAGLQGVEA